MDIEKVTIGQIESFKQNIRSRGIASYSINGLSEDESIRHAIAESWSFDFVAVRDPYHSYKNRGAKSFRFRIFQINIAKPQIPMGYSGMPLFHFECYDGQPSKRCVELLRSKFQHEYRYKIEDDLITCYRVLNEFEQKEKSYKKEYLFYIKEGQEAVCHWSYSNKQFKARCEVIKVNEASYKCKLLEAIEVDGDDFNKKWFNRPVGFIVTIPRRKQTQFNCLTAA